MRKRVHVSDEILIFFFDVCEEGRLIVGIGVDFLRRLVGEVHLVFLYVVPLLFLRPHSVDHLFVIFKIKVIDS